MNTVALNVMVGAGEAGLLDRCLKSFEVLGLDEILVCLTSDDLEVEAVARRYASDVIRYSWMNNFAYMRNRCLDHTQSDYVLWCDADDMLTKKQALAMIQAVQIVKQNNFGIYTVDYHVGLAEGGEPFSIIPRVSFFRKCKELRWQYPIHECLTLDKKMSCLKLSGVSMTHAPDQKERDPRRNLTILEREVKDGNCDPRMIFYLGKELLKVQDYEKGIAVLAEFIDNKEGNTDELAMACYMVAHFYAYGSVDGNKVLVLDNVSMGETYVRIGLQYNQHIAELWVLLGDILDCRGLKKKAIDCYDKAMQCKIGTSSLPQNVNYYKFIPADRLSCLYFLEGKYCEALYYNDVALKQRKEDRLIRNRKMILDELKEEYNGLCTN